MKKNYITPFIFLITFFYSCSSFSKDQTKCSLEFKSITPTVGSVTAAVSAPELQAMLESKGYSATLIQMEDENWRQLSPPLGISKINPPEIASKLNERAFLRFDVYCYEKSGGLFSFGSKKKWECLPAHNKANLNSVSGDQIFTGNYSLGKYDITFASEAEGRSYVINQLAKQMPTCDELRLKLPLTVLSKAIETKAPLKSIDTNDSSRGTVKERQELDEPNGTSANSIQK